MNRTQLEHIIRAASQISGDAEIVVIGSHAIHAQSMKLPLIAFQSDKETLINSSGSVISGYDSIFEDLKPDLKRWVPSCGNSSLSNSLAGHAQPQYIKGLRCRRSHDWYIASHS